jgi:RNA polymerase sigma-70 factor (ECF subfamily)
VVNAALADAGPPPAGGSASSGEDRSRIDLALVRRVLDGDPDAFEGLVRTHTGAVFALAFRVLGERSAAEDAVQETFLRAYRFLGRFDQKARFSTWLHKVALNAAIDQSRRRKVDRVRHEELPEEGPGALAEIPTEGPDPERRARAAEIGRRTRVALAGLTPTERAAFLLRHYEGRSIAEIAGALGKRENATKQSIFRAVRKLRQALAPWGEGVAHEEAV